MTDWTDTTVPALGSSAPASYVFVRDAPLLYLSPDFWASHNVGVVNVSVPEECLTKGPFLSFMIQVFGNYDTVVINQLMYTFMGSDGLVQVRRITP
jgi:hypothetical protein